MLCGKVVRPSARHDGVEHYQSSNDSNERSAIRASGCNWSSRRYKASRDLQIALRISFEELAAARVGYGYLSLQILLQREGWPANHKCIYRQHSEVGLSILFRKPRRRAGRYQVGRPAIGGVNRIWAIDFVSERLFDSRSSRMLTTVDCHASEALFTAARKNLRAYLVIDKLDRLARVRGRPAYIRLDTGLEFAYRLLNQRAYLNNIELDFQQPGKLNDNAFIGAFNGRLRAECLNASWLTSVADAHQRIK